MFPLYTVNYLFGLYNAYGYDVTIAIYQVRLPGYAFTRQSSRLNPPPSDMHPSIAMYQVLSVITKVRGPVSAQPRYRPVSAPL